MAEDLAERAVCGGARNPLARRRSAGAGKPGRLLDAIEKRLDEIRKKDAEEQAAHEREEKGPDPSDPDYLNKMADRMLSHNILYSGKAIDVLLKAEPAAASPETKKKVAQAFKALAEDDHAYYHDKAIQGLVKWAGKYSVPVLLKMLDNGHSSDEDRIIRCLPSCRTPAPCRPFLKLLDGSGHIHEELILRTLAEMKDPRAAPALAARLKGSYYEPLARAGLVAMGSGAEERAACRWEHGQPRTVHDRAGSAGRCGNRKVSRPGASAQASRDRALRLAAMDAAAKINRRRLKAKSKPENGVER